jgi:hypothetical protein
VARAAFTVARPQSTALRPLNYSPEVERLRVAEAGTVPLGSLLRELGPAYGAVFTRRDCSREHGIELLSQSDMFALEPAGRVIRRDSMPRPDEHLVRRWQVLVAGAGTLGAHELYGRCILADDRLAGRYVGPDAVALTFADEGSDLSLYVYAFLASPIGTRAIRATSYGTKVLRVRTDMLAALSIPIPDAATVHRVASLVREAVRSQEQHAMSLRAARDVVEELSELREAHEMCAERHRRAVVWSGQLSSLSARSVALAGAAAAHLRRRWGSDFSAFLEPDGIFTGPRFARIECEPPFGVELMSQKDLFSVRPLPQRVLPPHGDQQRLLVRSMTMLSAAVGQISEGTLFGRVFLSGPDTNALAFSQNIMRFQVRTGFEELAYAFFSTTVGYRLLQSAAVGSGYLAMSPKLAARLPFPSVTDTTVASLRLHVADALRARAAAARAEASAMRIVSEEVVPQWLA